MGPNMATCQVGKFSVVCEGGCGLICSGSQCWSWCEPVPDPVVIPAVMLFRSDDAAEADEVPQGSAMLTMCVNSATRRSLVHVLETMIRRSLSSSTDVAEDTLVEPFTGSLDELLTYHGLRRGDT
jgi:hypothetical protein